MIRIVRVCIYFSCFLLCINCAVGWDFSRGQRIGSKRVEMIPTGRGDDTVWATDPLLLRRPDFPRLKLWSPASVWQYVHYPTKLVDILDETEANLVVVYSVFKYSDRQEQQALLKAHLEQLGDRRISFILLLGRNRAFSKLPVSEQTEHIEKELTEWCTWIMTHAPEHFLGVSLDEPGGMGVETIERFNRLLREFGNDETGWLAPMDVHQGIIDYEFSGFDRMTHKQKGDIRSPYLIYFNADITPIINVDYYHDPLPTASKTLLYESLAAQLHKPFMLFAGYRWRAPGGATKDGVVHTAPEIEAILQDSARSADILTLYSGSDYLPYEPGTEKKRDTLLPARSGTKPVYTIVKNAYRGFALQAKCRTTFNRVARIAREAYLAGVDAAKLETAVKSVYLAGSAKYDTGQYKEYLHELGNVEKTLKSLRKDAVPAMCAAIFDFSNRGRLWLVRENEDSVLAGSLKKHGIKTKSVKWRSMKQFRQLLQQDDTLLLCSVSPGMPEQAFLEDATQVSLSPIPDDERTALTLYLKNIEGHLGRAVLLRNPTSSGKESYLIVITGGVRGRAQAARTLFETPDARSLLVPAE